MRQQAVLTGPRHRPAPLVVYPCVLHPEFCLDLEVKVKLALESWSRFNCRPVAPFPLSSCLEVSCKIFASYFSSRFAQTRDVIGHSLIQSSNSEHWQKGSHPTPPTSGMVDGCPIPPSLCQLLISGRPVWMTPEVSLTPRRHWRFCQPPVAHVGCNHLYNISSLAHTPPFFLQKGSQALTKRPIPQLRRLLHPF